MSSQLLRRGMSFSKFILVVLVLAVLTVLGWGVFANWNLDANEDGQPDGFTFRVLDPAWWTASKEKAQPLVDYSFEKAAAAKESIWGDGGVIDEVEAWLDARAQAKEGHGQDTATSAVVKPSTDSKQGGRQPSQPAAVEAAPKSPRTQRLEERIHTAEDLLKEGVSHYRAGVPAEHGWTDTSVAELNEAKQCFTQVRKLLQDEGTLDDYGDLDDHDPRLLSDAQQILMRNQKLLHSVNKIGSDM